MPSTEHSTLSRIQQEIQDVIQREQELKKLNSINGYNQNDEEDEIDEVPKTTLMRIQDEIQNVIEREKELKKTKNNTNGFSNVMNINTNGTNGNNGNFYNNEDSAGEELNGDHTDRSSNESDAGSKTDDADHQRQHQSLENDNTGSHGGVPRVPLFRAKSTSVLAETAAPTKPNFRRLISANPNMGFMQRFIKSRGKMQALTSLTTKQGSQQMLQPKTPFVNAPMTNGFNNNIDTYELAPPKIAQGQQFLRKNFIPTDKKIQQDIEATYKRETELKTLRQSQTNLAILDDTELDAPLENYGLRASKSMAQLYNSEENLDEPVANGSAPTSLKPARSLAQLCDAKDEEVTSPQALITHFQQMIIKNQESNRT